MAKVSIEFKKGSRNWQAFYDGKLSGDELFKREYYAPIADEITKALPQSGDQVIQLLEDTVTGWSEPPVFVVNARANMRDPDNASAEVVFLITGPGAVKWNWIDKGTKLHRIPRAGRKPISPMPIRPYNSRTSSGTGLPKSSGSGVHEGAVAFRNVVYQQIKPRDFTGRIQEFLRRDNSGFKNTIRNAIRRAKTRLGL